MMHWCRGMNVGLDHRHRGDLNDLLQQEGSYESRILLMIQERCSWGQDNSTQIAAFCFDKPFYLGKVEILQM